MGNYSRIRSLRSNSQANEISSREECDFFIYGGDLSSILAFRFLNEKYPDKKTRLIWPFEINKNNLLAGSSLLLRGEESFKLLQESFPSIEFALSEKTPHFYKDQKFRPFGGRAKSEPLQEFEDFFLKKKIEGNLGSGFLNGDSQLDELLAKREERDLSELSYKDDRWDILMTSGEVISAGQLIFGDSTDKFLKFFAQKTELDDEIFQVLSLQSPIKPLFFRLKLDGEICEQRETLFLPQSFTHERGHFIGEFYDVGEDSSQELEFLCFLDGLEQSPEEMSKKFRLFKRILSRIFPDFSSRKILDQFLYSPERNPCLSLNQESLKNSSSKISNCSFVGPDAPFEVFLSSESSCEYSKGDLRAMTRSLLSYHSFQNNFQTLT